MRGRPHPDPQSAKRHAERLLLARGGALLQATPEDAPASEADAYAIQALVAARLGPIGGFKAGRRQAGDTPAIAPIQGAAIRAGCAVIPAGESRLRGVELEIGFVLLADPPDPTIPDFLARLRASVAALPALEIVESRLSDAEAAGPLWKLADNQINGSLVLGAPVADWSGCDLCAPAARLEIGTDTVWNDPAPVPGGDAFATLAAFVGAVGSHCGGLRRGHVVITGTITGLRHARAGQPVIGHIEGLGSVSACFE